MSKIIFAGVCIIEVALSNGKVFAFAGGTDFEERVAKDINSLKDERVKAIFVPCPCAKFICLN